MSDNDSDAGQAPELDLSNVREISFSGDAVDRRSNSQLIAL